MIQYINPLWYTSVLLLFICKGLVRIEYAIQEMNSNFVFIFFREDSIVNKHLYIINQVIKNNEFVIIQVLLMSPLYFQGFD